MRIAINTRLWLPGRMDGIGWFTAEVTRRLVLAHPEHEFYLLFDRRPPDVGLDVPNAHLMRLAPPARAPLLWWAYFEGAVALALRRLKADLFISPDGWMPLHSAVPCLDVIHDLNFEHYDHFVRPSHERYYRHFFPRFARRATRIATVSAFSKADIAQTYGIPPERIDVVYDGSHAHYTPHSAADNEATRRRLTGGSPYFIFIGTISKRKNLTNTLLAFDRLKDASPSDAKMLIVGSRTKGNHELEQALASMHHAADVVEAGRVDAPELARMLSAAVALVYVSMFEGFGIPILEAFYAETAVITSNTTSIPEVAGEAALMVPPADVAAIADAMHRLLTDEAERLRLIALGRHQRTLFSWDRTAHLLWQSAMQTLNTPCDR